MPLSDDKAIERHTLRFIDRSLPKAEWTHAGHFAAALWLLRHRPELAHPDAMRTLITGYNEATDTANSDTSGYHHTITVASLRAAAQHLEGHAPNTPISMVLESLMASNLGDHNWLLTYWNKDTLFSTDARKAWVEPDLAALPF